jgi:hypothetical protein
MILWMIVHRMRIVRMLNYLNINLLTYLPLSDKETLSKLQERHLTIKPFPISIERSTKGRHVHVLKPYTKPRLQD